MKEKKAYFGDMQDIELAPDNYDDYAAEAAYGVPARYKDVPRPGRSFNYDQYVPQDPTYDPFYSDKYYFEDAVNGTVDNRTEQERQRYGTDAMPVFGRFLYPPYYLPQVVVDEQGYPQPTGRAEWGNWPERPFYGKNYGEKVQFDYRNVNGTAGEKHGTLDSNESDKRRRREDFLYNLMRERMKFD